MFSTICLFNQGKHRDVILTVPLRRSSDQKQKCHAWRQSPIWTWWPVSVSDHEHDSHNSETHNGRSLQQKENDTEMINIVSIIALPHISLQLPLHIPPENSRVQSISKQNHAEHQAHYEPHPLHEHAPATTSDLSKSSGGGGTSRLRSRSSSAVRRRCRGIAGAAPAPTAAAATTRRRRRRR